MVAGISKHQQIVQGVINSIDEGVLKEGDMLPSVNTMVEELGFARKTIVKAYTALKERGLIEAKNRRGYFVDNTATNQTIKIMLMMYAFGYVQRLFFETFQQAVGKNVQIDTFFHHNNPKVFRTLIMDSLGKYGLYIIAPIHKSSAREELKLIPANRLLLIDRYENLGSKYSIVAQRFADPVYRILQGLKERINDFNRMVLFYREDKDYPSGTAKAFRRFTNEQGAIKARVERFYMPGSLRRQTVYYTIHDSDLWAILKDCQEKGWELGKDIGIISQDDTPVKQLIMGGITCITTDFQHIAKRAAEFLHHRKKIQETVPTRLIRRQSL
ncbi:MAG: GntR family transcriptional regulator [Bacteroidota bacterium]